MSKVKIEIKNKFTGSVLFEYEKENNTMKETVEQAIKNEANLRGADLGGAYLYLSDYDINVDEIINNFEKNTGLKIKEWYINHDIIPTEWNCFL